MFRLKAALFGGALAMAAAIPLAAPSLAQTAADLGKTLTPMGAIKAGNADGTIPEWTGGITKPPAGWQPGQLETDPFAADKPLFTIDAKNVDKYADKLPEGLKALIKQYPDTYKMPVYPTRRSAGYPQRIYDETIANATRAKLAAGGNGVEGAKEGVPFPIPTEGVQAVWNHLLRYRGLDTTRRVGQANPQVDGSFTMIMLEEKVKYLYQAPGGTTGNTSLFFLQEVVEPARLAGEILLVHETINQVAEPRSAWTYNPGQRRVRRAPNVGYDNPGTASDGLRTNDNFDMFSGAPDRYDWKLLGRQEMYVPYNSYKLHSKEATYNQIIKPRHINQDLARYELHRVWVVEATLKQGTSHVYAKRRFYIDEDSWQILVADHYDGRGQMWRVAESHGISYYAVPTYYTTLDTLYDLQSGRYTAIGFDNQEPPYKFDANLSTAEFSPDSLRRAGVR
ncbi:DUF1329 domain-containing protein [Aerophototrophica crusticola]|uniref:DUF1329 domain-containing protein n=1 Tax=Aerophototrophica crusticola TaxID=1709002 RepID=A0A858R326_9PROT|nr:DUF1329 domain-containing protein [Rhodospirillaceae bacterium B3]